MTAGTMATLAIGAGLAVMGASVPAGLDAQTLGGGATAVEVSVSKPIMGENYDPLSGLLGVEARLARGATWGLILDGVVVRSSQGRTTSTTLANPTVGAWTRVARIPLEVKVSLPLMREFGDDDFATDMGRLSDLQHRERYLPGRWAVSVASNPQVVFRDGSAGMNLGGVAVLPHAQHDLDVRARLEAWFNLRFQAGLRGGARLSGTVRLNGDGGFDQRTQQDLTVFVSLPRLPGYPELSFRLPVDIDLQDFVTGVVAVKVRF